MTIGRLKRVGRETALGLAEKRRIGLGGRTVASLWRMLGESLRRGQRWV